MRVKSQKLLSIDFSCYSGDESEYIKWSIYFGGGCLVAIFFTSEVQFHLVCSSVLMGGETDVRVKI